MEFLNYESINISVQTTGALSTQSLSDKRYRKYLNMEIRFTNLNADSGKIHFPKSKIAVVYTVLLSQDIFV